MVMVMKEKQRNIVIDMWKTLAILLVFINHFFGLVYNVIPSNGIVFSSLQKWGG